MSSPDAWTPLAPRDLRQAESVRRLLASIIWSGLCWGFGQESVFRWILRRGLAAAGQRPFFGVPTALALVHFRDALLLEVPTRAVEHRLVDWVEGGGTRFHIDTCFLGNGDWSVLASPLDKSSVVVEARELLAQDMNYRATRSYRHYTARLRQGRPLRRNNVALDSPELVDAYFGQYLGLFESIRTNGLLRRSARPEAVSHTALRSRWAERREREIGIAIGPAGELYRLPGGQHRTAIARALELPRLPVQVRLVHTDWVRQQMELHDLPPTLAIRRGLAGLSAQYC